LQLVAVSLLGISGWDVDSAFEGRLLLWGGSVEGPTAVNSWYMHSYGGKDQHEFGFPSRRPDERWCLSGGTLVGMLSIGGSMAWNRIEDGLGVASAAITDSFWGGGSVVIGSLRGLLRLGSSSKHLAGRTRHRSDVDEMVPSDPS
jgi:hypothetical protein